MCSIFGLVPGQIQYGIQIGVLLKETLIKSSCQQRLSLKLFYQENKATRMPIEQTPILLGTYGCVTFVPKPLDII